MVRQRDKRLYVMDTLRRKIEKNIDFIYVKYEDSEVENFLAEKYILKGEVKAHSQDLKFYRLRD